MLNSSFVEIRHALPRCRQNVDLTINQCPKCKRKLKPLVLSQKIPLSNQQRQALRSDIIVLSIALFVLAGIFSSLALALKKVPMFIWPIFGLMLAVVGFYLLSRARSAEWPCANQT